MLGHAEYFYLKYLIKNETFTKKIISIFNKNRFKEFAPKAQLQSKHNFNKELMC